MSELVVKEDDPLILELTPEPDISVVVTPPSISESLTITPPSSIERVVVTQDRGVSLTISTEPEPTTSVTIPENPTTLVVVGDRDVLAVQQALQDHISSETPHPAYDSPEGPSLVLLYQNAKV